MIQIAHLALGTAATRIKPLPMPVVTGLAVGIASHMLLDSIPHFEPSNLLGTVSNFNSPAGVFVWIDFFAAWIMVAALFKLRLFKINTWSVAIIIGCYGPDVIDNAPYINQWLAPHFSALTIVHRSTHEWWRPLYAEPATLSTMLFGIATTVLTVAICLSILTGKARERSRKTLAVPVPTVD